jgi:hypothetical protein
MGAGAGISHLSAPWRQPEGTCLNDEQLSCLPILIRVGEYRHDIDVYRLETIYEPREAIVYTNAVMDADEDYPVSVGPTVLPEIWAPRLYAQGLHTLEVGSSGRWRSQHRTRPRLGRSHHSRRRSDARVTRPPFSSSPYADPRHVRLPVMKVSPARSWVERTSHSSDPT